MTDMQLSFTGASSAERELRAEVRAFIAEEQAREPDRRWAGGYDDAFTRRLAGRGWVGMVIPQEYGGPGRSPVEQFVVAEELLAAGAPIGAHHAADRQTAPMLLRFGSERQKRWFLPKIAAGTCGFALGMSEPDSGSDLASVRTRATGTPDGWRLTGTKVWTSWADRVPYAVVLCRTAPPDAGKHAGLSQLIVDLRSPGVEIRPITTLDGQAHFCEVHLDEVDVPADMTLGDEGEGWTQISSELSYERGGPDRWLSTFRVYAALVRAVPSLDPDAQRDAHQAIGRCAAWYRALHTLSYGIACAVAAGQEPAVEAAAVKDIGTTFEQRVLELAREVATAGDAGDPDLAAAIAELLLVAPGFTIRGGSTEVLRSIVANALTR